jgi:hypothetical protein
MVRLRDGEAFQRLCCASIPHTGFAASYDIVGSLDIADSDELAADEPAAHEPAAHEPAAHEPAAHEPAAHEPATNHAPLWRRRWRRRLLRLADAAVPGVQAMDPQRGPAPGPSPAPPDIASPQDLDAFSG